MFIKFIAIAALVISGNQSMATDFTKPVEPVATLDIYKYSGTWHELARLPNYFQKKCAGDTVANYTLLEDNKIRVVNTCMQHNGKIAKATGVARKLNNTDQAKLQVTFVPALSFLPIVWGDYWVLYIDNDYQYALVGEKSREYLWLLSRSNTQFNKHKIQQALNVAKEQGFDISKLIYSYKLDN